MRYRGKESPAGYKALRHLAWTFSEKEDEIAYLDSYPRTTASISPQEAWEVLRETGLGTSTLSAETSAHVSFPAAMWNLHANDLGKGFGDKTREWEMDTVAALMKPKGDDADDSSMRF